METVCSAVQLLVEFIAVETRALLVSQYVCRDIPRIIPGQVYSTQKRWYLLASPYPHLQGEIRLA